MRHTALTRRLLAAAKHRYGDMKLRRSGQEEHAREGKRERANHVDSFARSPEIEIGVQVEGQEEEHSEKEGRSDTVEVRLVTRVDLQQCSDREAAVP